MTKRWNEITESHKRVTFLFGRLQPIVNAIRMPKFPFSQWKVCWWLTKSRQVVGVVPRAFGSELSPHIRSRSNIWLFDTIRSRIRDQRLFRAVWFVQNKVIRVSMDKAPPLRARKS